MGNDNIISIIYTNNKRTSSTLSEKVQHNQSDELDVIDE